MKYGAGSLFRRTGYWAHTMSHSKPFLLSVLTGPNAGASTAFGTAKMQLGGGREDNIVLAGLSPDCLAFKGDGNRLRIAARSEGLSCHDGATGVPSALPTGGAVYETELPATLRLNSDTVITISRLHADTRRRLGLPASLAIGAIALSMGLWLGANSPDAASPPETQVAMDSTDPATNPTQTAEAAAPAAPPDLMTATSPKMSCTGDCATSAAEGLQTRMQAEGLDGLTLSVEDGIFRVTGALPANKTDVWRQLRANFESDFGQSLPLVVQVHEGDASPILAVSSVWLGKAPEIRTKSGTVLRIGDTTGDGWIIQSIAKGEIELARGSQTTTVRF